MNSGEIRKRLLIAESEVNRAQMVREITALKAGCRTLARRTRVMLDPVAMSAAVLAMGLKAFLRGRSATPKA